MYVQYSLAFNGLPQPETSFAMHSFGGLSRTTLVTGLTLRNSRFFARISVAAVLAIQVELGCREAVLFFFCMVSCATSPRPAS